jgi:hypothetical protein
MPYNETPFKENAVKKIEILKKTVKLVIGVGASTIVRQLIENNVEPEKTIDKVAVPVASLAIGGAVGQAAGAYTDAMIDDVVDAWNNYKNREQSAE